MDARQTVALQLRLGVVAIVVVVGLRGERGWLASHLVPSGPPGGVGWLVSDVVPRVSVRLRGERGRHPGQPSPGSRGGRGDGQGKRDGHVAAHSPAEQP